MKSRERRVVIIEPLETRIAPAFVSGTVNLADLGPAIDGSTGSAFHGVSNGDFAGASVGAAGDVNGDGFGDFLIGATQLNTGSGAAYVIFGTAAGFPADATLNATFLDGTKGFALLGESSGDVAGYSVGAAGDVNGDGFDDVIVGARDADGGVNFSGIAYVVFGKAGGFAPQLALGGLDGREGFKISGVATGDEVGCSVSGAGDVNGDGFDDVIVGAYRVGGNGAAFIIYGKAGGFAANLPISGLTAAQGVRINGVSNGDQAGFSVSGAGDVNGDGFDDVIIGARFADDGGTSSGAAYVVFGGNALGATIELSALGSSGFRMTGVAANDYAGSSVSGAGDVNGDGLADVIVGAFGAGTGGSFASPGAAYIVFGNAAPFAPQFSLDTAAAVLRLDGAAGDDAGSSVSGAGDVNGDGIDDLIVGFTQTDVSGGAGGAYVVFGRTDLLANPPTFATLNGSNGFKLAGEETDSVTGKAVSGAGDVNGDGFADLLVGAYSSDDGGTNKGQAYLVYGGPGGTFIAPTTISADTKTVTWTDVDGDIVTLRFSLGSEAVLDDGTIKLLARSATDSRAQLLELKLGSEFNGQSVSITAKRAGGGDGRVNVGFINAAGVDLGAVTVSGDLGRIVAGDAVNDLSLKSLTVGSFGLFGGRTGDTTIESGQDASALTSTIRGAMGPLKVAGDMRADFNVVNVAGASDGANLASVTIGGSLLGGEFLFVGDIFADGRIGPVKIAGDVRGDAGRGTGYIEGRQGIASVTVGGSLLGSSGDRSGFLGGAIGPVTIGGSVLGGSGLASGAITNFGGSIGKVSIKGDLVGGSAEFSGVIFTNASGGNIAGVKIGGDARAGSVPTSGGIFAEGKVGPVVIGGDATGTAAQPFKIRGGGALTGTASLAIASVKVGGDFEHALILGGYGDDDAPVNGHAQIGAISVGGDWIASSVSAGVLTHAGAANADGVFGNGDDVFATGGPNVFAFIQSITIKGTARGTFENGDRFGIVAEHIGFVSIGGKKLPLDPGIASDLAGLEVGPTPDFVVREISRTAAAPTPTFTPTPDAGPRSAWPASFNLATLNGANGFTIDAGVGGFVSSAGDVNGDGFDDVLIGDYSANSAAGTAYVVFGKASGFGANVPFSSLDGSNGFAITGVAANNRAGRSVAAAGDVNGDGFDDLIVGALGANAAYVVLGRSGFAATLGLGTLDGTNGFKLTGAAGDSAGLSVGGGVDVNRDGFDDVIVGSVGEAYVVFGRKTSAANVALGTLDGSDGFKLIGPGQAGFFVGGAGDVNGDGRGDVIVGGRDTNAAWVLFGADDFSSTPAIDLALLDGADGFTISGVGTGDNIVSTAGDVNGDGFADVIVGANTAGTAASGTATVVFGRARFTSTPNDGFAIAAASLDGANGFTLTGAAAGDGAGRAVSGGDVNGDGFSDLIVGAYQAGGGSGAAYVVFGKAGGFAASQSLSTLDGADGFAMPGSGQTGFHASTAGDVNGDGYTDFIIGPQDHVVFGGPSGEFIDPTFSNGGTTATWTDVDGDLVTLKVTKGTLDATNFLLLANSSTDARARLLSLGVGTTIGTLSEFDGASITLTAKRAGGGDGKVNLGFLAAQNTDLGAVKIAGDLGGMFVGDGDDGMGLKSLTVGSVRAFGGLTQDFGGDARILIAGPAGPVKVAGDFREGTLLGAPAATAGTGTIASVTIGGSLIGGARGGSGAISAAALGPVKIVGDLVGGAGTQSGYILGSSLGSVTVGGSMLGGRGNFSGTIQSFGGAGNLTIGGSQRGGDGAASGAIFTAGSIGRISIKGDQLGGEGEASGLIFANGGSSSIASVTIGGDARGGDASFSGGILAGGTLGPVNVKGDVIGTAEQAYLIRGAGPLTGTKSIAIASVKVGGDLDHALILAGFGQNNAPVNGHAQIGAISVGGDWIASSVTAGLLPRAGALDATGVFGNGDDTFIADGTTRPNVIAFIASITIKGRAVGTLETGDRFGIVAEHIGSLTIGGVKLPLDPGIATDLAGIAVGPTPDFYVREVARV